jgi:hypothetical protein
MSDDIVEQAGKDVKSLAKDYFGIGDNDADTFMKIAKKCAVKGGIPLAGAGAAALASVGSVAVPLIGSIPGYLAGAIGGFVGGTTACIIASKSSTNTEHMKQLLSQSQMSEQQFKSEVRRLISLAQGKAGYYS